MSSPSFDIPVTEEVVLWVKDVVEEIWNVLPSPSGFTSQEPSLDKLPRWGTHWEAGDEPRQLVKRMAFTNEGNLAEVRCLVDLDAKTFQFSWDWIMDYTSRKKILNLGT
jgi:hypothetical protein